MTNKSKFNENVFIEKEIHPKYQGEAGELANIRTINNWLFPVVLIMIVVILAITHSI